ncbi:hypothetical protein VST7929_02041 [Vibrio stylophorae]|uniref:Negative regulator of flagellin synthesis n=1 Tax=Vibrio stylophorae TaxID=659351 RepID=A0ABN8DTI8_9VIBR|nr:flagellar biosynthesis anti-sigma factor FlgM [Vibrio stylophorae]CAH0534140.1 hypothetical protein VST7929_02041 [Vibrio stylophorae]
MTGIDHLRGSAHLTATRTSQGKSSNVASTSDSSASRASSNVQGDDVQLSEQSKIHQQLATEPAFDSDKVAAIKAAIASGAYQIDADKLADNMMKFESELRNV